jgi:outer membrane receptor for ferrienterochelin and colicins
MVGAGIGYIGRYNQLNDNEINEDGFLFSPEVKANIKYNWSKIGLQVAVYYKYTGVLPTIYKDEDGNLFESRINDYHIADLTLSKYVWKKRVKLTAGIKNIFDVTTVTGSSAVSGEAHSSATSGVNIGIGRTFNFGIKIHINN